jgi:hypothetical protein
LRECVGAFTTTLQTLFERSRPSLQHGRRRRPTRTCSQCVQPHAHAHSMRRHEPPHTHTITHIHLHLQAHTRAGAGEPVFWGGHGGEEPGLTGTHHAVLLALFAPHTEGEAAQVPAPPPAETSACGQAAGAIGGSSSSNGKSSGSRESRSGGSGGGGGGGGGGSKCPVLFCYRRAEGKVPFKFKLKAQTL